MTEKETEKEREREPRKENQEETHNRKKLTIVLNGGLKGCCSVYPVEFVDEVVKDWLAGQYEHETIDAKKGEWRPDGLAELALKYFEEGAYPFIYVDGVLRMLGHFPEQRELLAMLLQGAGKPITREDILETAQFYGIKVEE